MKRILVVFSIFILILLNFQINYVQNNGKIFPFIKYNIYFNETGLPVGYEWSVQINGTQENSTSKSILFTLSNGTYNFTVYSKNKDLYPVPSSGTFNVSGKILTINITFKWNNYTVNFTEKGLPQNTKWWVDLNNTVKYSYSNYITFSLPNGSYNFEINSSSQYTPNPSSGKLIVNGSNVTIQITFSYSAYNVSFIEYGLPSNTLWGIYIGKNLYKTYSNSVTIFLKNGTYTYSVYVSNKDFYTKNPNGIFTVSGSSQIIFILFQPYLSKVYFNETGLPSNLTWYVKLNNSIYETNKNSILIELMNGSYSFYIISSDKNYYPIPNSGKINVTGKTLNITVKFMPYLYIVNFTEQGLPNNTTWGIIYDKTYYTNQNYLILRLMNGTYNVTVFDNNSKYMPQNKILSFTVNGSSEHIEVNFIPVLYHVIFQEVGLPIGIKWYVNISNNSYSSENSSIIIDLQNGSYYFTVQSSNKIYYPNESSGYFYLNGSLIIIKIQFLQYLIPVNFTENGLPSYVSWSIIINSKRYYSNSSYILIYLTNGSYEYIPSASYNIYFAKPGIINVSGQPLNVQINFYELNYSIIFYAKFVPKFTFWGVNLSNGMRKMTYLHEIIFNLTNGTYHYHIWIQNSSYSPVQANGTIIVFGHGTNISVNFRYLIYTVNFVEYGLPNKYHWYIDINSENITTQNQNVSFKLLQGHYIYYYGTIDRKYSCGMGELNLTKNMTVIIKFIPEKYEVIFFEEGLPYGTLWQVTINGTTFSSANQNIDTMLFNGTYLFNVKSVPGYIPLNPQGIIHVNGKPISIMVSFTIQMYLITITLSNMPNGVNWSVNVIGREFNGQSINLVFHSNSPTISFYLPNGSYEYYINLPNNYMSTSSSGHFVIYGGAVSEFSQVFYIPLQTMLLYIIWFLSGIIAFTVTKIKTGKKG
ncbi:MAG: hypothetical protein ACP5JT_02865 [Thermoplasmata archaeon]